MTHPQQPELDRSGRGATDQRSAERKADPNAPAGSAAGGPTPTANAPADAVRSGTASRTRDALEK